MFRLVKLKWWFFQGNLKQKTCDDLAKYVKRDERLPQVLLSHFECTAELTISFSGVVQFAEVRSKNFPPHKQWLGVHKSGAGSDAKIDVVECCLSHVNL